MWHCYQIPLIERYGFLNIPQDLGVGWGATRSATGYCLLWICVYCIYLLSQKGARCSVVCTVLSMEKCI